MYRILAYGDSNTYGWDPRDFMGGPYEEPWPAVLEKSLTQPAKVINLGEPGRTIDFPLKHRENFHNDLKSREPFNQLILMLGTNDLLNSSRPAASAVGRRMDELLGMLRTWYPDLKILVLCPPAVQFTTEKNADVYLQESRELAEQYRVLAEKRHANYFNTQNFNLSMAFDGVHLTEDSHKVLGEALVAASFGIL